MSRQGVHITGVAELMAKLRNLPYLVDRAAARAVEKQTEITADDMRRGAPFLTGELRESIQAEFDPKTITGRAVATARHAGFVEHGTDDTPAQPFVQPAAERTRRAFPGRVKLEVREELRKQ